MCKDCGIASGGEEGAGAGCCDSGVRQAPRTRGHHSVRGSPYCSNVPSFVICPRARYGTFAATAIPPVDAVDVISKTQSVEFPPYPLSDAHPFSLSTIPTAAYPSGVRSVLPRIAVLRLVFVPFQTRIPICESVAPSRLDNFTYCSNRTSHSHSTTSSPPPRYLHVIPCQRITLPRSVPSVACSRTMSTPVVPLFRSTPPSSMTGAAVLPLPPPPLPPHLT